MGSRWTEYIHPGTEHAGAAGLALLVALMLTACRHAPVTDPHSRFFVPPVGSRFTVHQTLTVPARSAQVYIQDGRVTRSVNFYLPHCKLWVRDISDHPQHIEPDQFTITAVARHTDCVVLVRHSPLQVASLDPPRLARGGLDDGPTDCRYYIEMRLHSDRQPQVRKLVCQQVDDAALGWYPTFDEIRLTLAPLADFTRPDGSEFPPPQAPPY